MFYAHVYKYMYIFMFICMYIRFMYMFIHIRRSVKREIRNTVNGEGRYNLIVGARLKRQLVGLVGTHHGADVKVDLAQEGFLAWETWGG